MTHVVRTRILTFCLAVLPAGLVFAQTQSSDVNSAAAATAPNVAYVYVGTSKGVNLYDAASSGKLTLVSGSPFKIAGTAADSNGKYFLTLGTQYLHSYPVAANGALKAQVSQINTADYAPGDCAAPGSASLDLTGQNVYVLMNPASSFIADCAAYQSFSLGATNGALAFQAVALVNPPAISSHLYRQQSVCICSEPRHEYRRHDRCPDISSIFPSEQWRAEKLEHHQRPGAAGRSGWRQLFSLACECRPR